MHLKLFYAVFFSPGSVQTTVEIGLDEFISVGDLTDIVVKSVQNSPYTIDDDSLSILYNGEPCPQFSRTKIS